MKKSILIPLALASLVVAAPTALADDWSVTIRVQDGSPAYGSSNATTWSVGQQGGDIQASHEQSSSYRSNWSTPSGSGSYERSSFDRSDLRIGGGEVEASRTRGEFERGDYQSGDRSASYARGSVDQATYRADDHSSEYTRNRASFATGQYDSPYASGRYAYASADRTSDRRHGGHREIEASHSDAMSRSATVYGYGGPSTYSESASNQWSSRASGPAYGAPYYSAAAQYYGGGYHR